jgi:hypothetical protein
MLDGYLECYKTKRTNHAWFIDAHTSICAFTVGVLAPSTRGWPARKN